MLAVSGFNRETSHGIFVMDGLHTPFRCLTKSLESPCVAPLWSLTNDLLAFTAIDKGYYRRHQLYAVDVSNDAMEPISDSLPYIYGLSWLPDAQHLALFEMEDDAWFLSLLDRVTRRIHRLLSIRTVVYTWSPDWTQLALSPATDDPHLYLSDLTGTQRQPITDQLPHVWKIDWSPDGYQLACTMSHAHGRELYVIGIDGSDLRKVADLSYESPVVWSPSGAMIAYVMDTQAGPTFATVDVATGRNTLLFPMHPDDPGEMLPTNPVWMKREDSLLVSSYVGDRFRLLQLDPLGTLHQDVTPPEAPEYLYDLAWIDHTDTRF